MMILITMLFNDGLIPTFIIIVNLGMFNTLFAIILPSIISVWNIILARTYINNMPSELKEAAYIDGASVYQTVTHDLIAMVVEFKKGPPDRADLVPFGFCAFAA